MQSFLHSVGEWVMPVLKESDFTHTGRLTPEEFVTAGDFLVFKCPTWQWAPRMESTIVRDFLPTDRQYLVTRGVPSLRRIDEEQLTMAGVDDANVVSFASGEEGAVNDLNNRSEGDESDIPDMDTYVEPVSEDTLCTRTYDLYITYDKYYQTPRLWLSGFAENGTPLPPKETILFDISTEHANKTVTIESFPHLPNSSMVSVHPCKHASVMQTIVGGSGDAVRVDQYLVVFLKWMSSVMPSVNYDFTMAQ